MDMDFSNLNLQYLLQARDHLREDPDRIATVLGMEPALARLLAETTAEELVLIPRTRMPLLAPRPELWWWSRLFRAVREERPQEVKAVMEHLALLTTS